MARSDVAPAACRCCNDRRQVCGPCLCAFPHSRQGRLAHRHGDRRAAVTAELHAAPFGASKRGLRALAYRQRFVLGDGRQDVDREAVRLREVDGVKLDACFHQVRDEGHVARQAIQLGDDQGRAVQATQLQGLDQFRSIAALAGSSTSVSSATRRQSPPSR